MNAGARPVYLPFFPTRSHPRAQRRAMPSWQARSRTNGEPLDVVRRFMLGQWISRLETRSPRLVRFTGTARGIR